MQLYATTFLPAVAARGAAAVGPPRLDIAWVWFLHRLAPGAYARDCQRAFGMLVDTDPSQPLAFSDGDFAEAAPQRPKPARKRKNI
ncbi:hypothetical protein T492DRAFT_933323 [Pavlovales sp. CCMP2436]|nr:hypothetical protein T492DRAFT_933323 [Pavlovales sp. CCMP2436]